jgi:hypothetical protein
MLTTVMATGHTVTCVAVQQRMMMQVGVTPGATSFGGKYAILLGASEIGMQMSWLSRVESSVIKRIEELQISDGASVVM